MYSDVANVTKYNEEIDTFNVVLDDKQKALEGTLEVINDNPENNVRLAKKIRRSSEHEEVQQSSQRV